jgi:hypothetical protein
MRILFLFITLVAVLSARANEGGPSWWWGCKQHDLIIRGKVTCDAKRYYRITSPQGEKGSGDHYYVCGVLKIEEVLYANSQSQYADNFRHYLRSTGQTIDVLVSADRVYTTHMKPEEIRLDPTASGAFYPDASIFTFDVVYMFPIGGLVLHSSVPADKNDDAMRLLSTRPHSLTRNAPVNQ